MFQSSSGTQPPGCMDKDVDVVREFLQALPAAERELTAVRVIQVCEALIIENRSLSSDGLSTAAPVRLHFPEFSRN